MEVSFVNRNTVNVEMYQFDYGQTLEIKGVTLPKEFEVHYQNGTSIPVTVKGTFDETKQIGTVSIPDECLQQNVQRFDAWLWAGNNKSGKTLKTIRFLLQEREKPSDVPPISSVDEINGYAEEVKANADKVKEVEQIGKDLISKAESGAFNGKQGPPGKDGKQGPPGEKGEQGPPGVAGKTPVKGEDYWTAEEEAKIKNEIFNQFNYLIIRKKLKGTPLILKDSSNLIIEDLKIYGPTTVSKVNVTGAQVLRPSLYDTLKTTNGITLVPNYDGTVTISGTPINSSGNLFTYYFGEYIDNLIDGQTYQLEKKLKTRYVENDVTKYSKPGESFTFNKATMTSVKFYTQRNILDYVDGEKYFPMVNLGDKPLTFEPYKEQSVILSQPITLATGESIEKRNDIYGKVSGDTFTALPDADSKVLLALNTFYPNSVFYCGTEIEIKYICDIEKYIDNKLFALNSAQNQQIASTLSLMPNEIQAAMIENDTKDLIKGV